MDYFGPVVNRAGVERVGSGGQILITDTVWANAQPGLHRLSKFVIKDMGNYLLRGIETETHLYEILPAPLTGTIRNNLVLLDSANQLPLVFRLWMKRDGILWKGVLT